jgi:bifunctional DNA-binding transcriptional regulator/antitoxin component of YhaV-PrlF toxin-antitoxin module
MTGEKEYFITFPEDLLEAANLKAGDEVEWVDRNDGSFLHTKS